MLFEAFSIQATAAFRTHLQRRDMFGLFLVAGADTEDENNDKCDNSKC